MMITPHHYAMLHDGSAISDTVIRQRGYQSLTRPDDLLDLGFSKVQARTAPALAIPLWDVHGQQGGWQIRPDSPRQFKDGTVAKYETPKGGRVSLDVHPDVQPALGDPSVALWVTEGVRKGDALASQGACCIALMGGVWGFRGSNQFGGRVILPDWQFVALNGRHVNVVFDSDLATKPNVQAALDALYRFLRERQALPGLVHWPEDFQQKKWGVDDYLANGHSVDELLAMIPPIGPLPSTRPRSKPDHGEIGAPLTEDPAAILDTVSPCTHVANARRLARLYTPTLRYVLGVGWILWTGKFWRPDPTADGALATGFVSGLARTIAEEAATLYAAAANTSTVDKRKALYALAEERGKWAIQSENATVIAAGLKLAKNALLLMHEAIDADPWLFNCQNGTVDLRTGKRHDHNPTDLITHLAPVTYDPDATCTTWENFLNEVFAGNPEMIAFMQRAIGWSLTGVVQDRALFFLYGDQGYNGKTTLVELVRDLLGTSGEESFGYARKVDIMTFMKSRNHEDNLRKAAALPGARFVYSSEIDEEHRLNEQLIKDMTGGDTVEARRLYHEAFTFKPTFKPWMYGNHKPEIRGTDNALWSRVKLVEFNVSFAERIDLDLPKKLRNELSGILNWAIQGCQAWQQGGLQPPERVRAATAAYRTEQDVIGQFIRECCQTGGDYMQCKASRLYAAYRRWADENGQAVLSQKRFGSYLTAHGYPSDDNVSGTGAIRKYIDLIQDADDHDPWYTGEFSTLRKERVEGTNSSNDAGKSYSVPSNSTLSTLGSDKFPIEAPYGELSEVRVERVETKASIPTIPLKTKEDTVSTLCDTKGRNSPCYICRGTVFWQNDAGQPVCERCHPQPTEERKV